MARFTLDNPAYYINREASWLGFNRRVLEEAEDETNPLLERLKFLAITASNLDEFFEVRVAGLMQQIEDGHTEAGPDGLTMEEEREILSRDTHSFVQDQYRCWNEDLRPTLAEKGIRILGLHELDSKGRAFAEESSQNLFITHKNRRPSSPFCGEDLAIAFTKFQGLSLWKTLEVRKSG